VHRKPMIPRLRFQLLPGLHRLMLPLWMLPR
jgi:hypothetical protein